MAASNFSIAVNKSTDDDAIGIVRVVVDALGDMLILITLVPSMLFITCMIYAICSEITLRANVKHIYLCNLVICDNIFLLSITIASIFYLSRTYFNVGGCRIYMNLYRGLFNNGICCITMMAVERYVAVCHPLRYHAIITQRFAFQSLGVIWFISFLLPLTEICYLISSDRVAFEHTMYMCDSMHIQDNSQIWHILGTVRTSVLVILFISSVITLITTYVCIVKVAKRACTSQVESSKAKNTVLLHMVQLIMYMGAFAIQLCYLLIEMFVSKYELKSALKTVVYLLLFVWPRFFSPFLYGIRDEEIRRPLKRMLGQLHALAKVRPT
ncbi:odorant receptor 131-2-like [Lethenteron reissneri]|uniref:odorant receptor 131-2-like n=1 Tax=Lethenteron reissneri TaxID=7753 RepID=UPI002AB68EFE|nr:odorant receptor 131-2-like [Lethenteron reissneri]XP_061419632.1 odorant receptor 131-2-like [Lethenteron reissneri]